MGVTLHPMSFLSFNLFTGSRKSLASATAAIDAVETALRLELKERRRTARPLPVPEAVELDEDSGWALWQESQMQLDSLLSVQ